MTVQRSWFETACEEPAPVAVPPVAVTSGHDPILGLTDGVARGTAILGRVSADPGLLALKVVGNERPVRVSLALAFDAATVSWWRERSDRAVPRGGERPRALAIRSQGAPRAATLLIRRRHASGSHAATRVRVSFDLGPCEIPDDGLLIVEIADLADHVPGFPARLTAPRGAVGIRVDAVEVEPAASGSPAPVSPVDASVVGWDRLTRDGVVLPAWRAMLVAWDEDEAARRRAALPTRRRHRSRLRGLLRRCRRLMRLPRPPVAG
jgi:hypothetical protein